MSILNDRNQMNGLRSIIDKAEDNEVIGKEEAGFIVLLANRFRADIEKKSRILLALQGEIAQLKANENIIMDIVQNLISAEERAKEREKTFDSIREHKQRRGTVMIEEDDSTDKSPSEE